MKSAHLKLSFIAVTALALGVSTLWAATSPQLASARKALRGVPAVEMPAKAAQLVSQAKAEECDCTAASVVAAALDVRPASVLAVVGAIARQVPEAAAPAAAKAATLQPKNLSDIAAAAAAAAPSQAAKIVQALCKAVPAKYAVIASAVAGAVPSATKEIIAAVTSAVPALKPFVDRAASDLSGDTSIAALMGRTEMLLRDTALAGNTTPEKVLAGGNSGGLAAPLPPPTVGDPFTPLPPGTDPSTVTRSMTRVALPGEGQDYSTP